MTGNQVWAFDGRILELFNATGSNAGGVRFHTAILGLEVSGPDRKGRMTVALRYSREKQGLGLDMRVEAEDYVRLQPLLERVRSSLR